MAAPEAGDARHALQLRLADLRAAAGFLREQAEQDYKSPVDDPRPGREALGVLEMADGREVTERLSATALEARVTTLLAVELGAEGLQRAQTGQAESAAKEAGADRASKARADGWYSIREPVLFDVPQDLDLPFSSRGELAELAAARRSDAMVCATALECAVAAQFGPRLLSKARPFSEVLRSNAWAEASQHKQQEDAAHWPLSLIHSGLPAWLRGDLKWTSTVLSMGPDGRGCAFHWSAGTWLLQLQGQTMWFLYDPGGPPTKAAYKELALCPAPLLPHAMAKLAPKDRPRCVLQKTGEGIFLPAFWWCASLNIGEVLSVGGRRSVGELDVAAAVRDNPLSSAALFELSASLHSSNAGYALEGLKRVLRGEHWNFFYHWQRVQLLHRSWPRKTVPVAEHMLELARKLLNDRQQYLVIRMAAPSFLLLAEVLAGKRQLAAEAAKAWRLAYAAVTYVDRYVQSCGHTGLPVGLRRAIDESNEWALVQDGLAPRCGKEDFAVPFGHLQDEACSEGLVPRATALAAQGLGSSEAGKSVDGEVALQPVRAVTTASEVVEVDEFEQVD